MSDARDQAHAAAVLQVRKARNPAYLANARENAETGEHLPATEAIALRRQLNAANPDRTALGRKRMKVGARMLARGKRLLGIS